MKKFLVVFVGLILVASPRLARAEAITEANTYSDPAQTASNGTTLNASTTAPQYALKSIDSTEQGHIASTAYVKGAYNSAIRSVNRVANDKQAKLDSGNGGNISVSGAGPIVTGISATAGAVTVTKGQISVPVGSSSGTNGQATIWIE